MASEGAGENVLPFTFVLLKKIIRNNIKIF